MSRFLIVSPNGYGNVGDDICAYSGRYLAKAINPSNKTIVTSPPFNEDLASKSDVIILSGGGVLYDRDAPNVENYTQYLDYAQRNGKKSAVIGVGVQGIVTDWGKKRYKAILNKTNLVTVRSEYDKRLLEEVGVNNVIATQDLGLLAGDWVTRPFFLPRAKKGKKPRLGLILMDVRFLQAYKKGEKKLKAYLEIVEANLARIVNDFDVYLFAHSKDDEDWRKWMMSQYGMRVVSYKTIKDFPRFFHLYRQMDLVMGLRFHSVILGLLAKKPVIGISSSNAKIFRLAASSQTLQDQCYSLGDADKLNDLFHNLRNLYDDGKFKTIPEADLANLKASALKNKKLLEAIL